MEAENRTHLEHQQLAKQTIWGITSENTSCTNFSNEMGEPLLHNKTVP